MLFCNTTKSPPNFGLENRMNNKIIFARSKYFDVKYSFFSLERFPKRDKVKNTYSISDKQSMLFQTLGPTALCLLISLQFFWQLAQVPISQPYMFSH
jgi:hypothetical protein